jgi:hypothetical protein
MILVATTLCLALSSFLPINSSQNSSNFTLPCTINTYGNAWDGALSFDLKGTGNYFVVMNTNGTILNMRESTTSYDGANYNIAANTIMFQGEPSTANAGTVWSICSTHFWNFATNTTQDFPNVLSEHDIQYNPVNNTFLTLRDYVRQVGNNSILFDRILQVAPDGTILWSWDTYNYIPLSQASPFNETAITKITTQTVEDFTHANSIDWDYNNSIIYLNLRNTNTFYKINQTTGNIIWACGEFGNFTLLGENGNPVSSLWYHSHNVKQVAPNVFTMFDNDFDNNTNPNNCHSRMLKLTLNETSMTAYVNWSWQAPTQYWNSYAGGTILLPNGDYIGDFGDPTHQFAQNQPWNFTNNGAVFVEVNPAGQIVRTWTFPAGWYVYRIEAVTNMTPFQIVSTPTPSPSATPSSPTIAPSISTPLPTSTPKPTPTPTLIATATPISTPTPSVLPSSNPTNTINSQPIINLILPVVAIVAVVVLVAVFYIKKASNTKTHENKIVQNVD